MERPKVIIRKHKDSERLDVVTLVEENKLVDGHVPGYIQGILDKRNVLVAEAEGQVIGTIIIDGPKRNQESDINFVAVHENFRNLGIGKSLVAHAEKILQELNSKKIRLLAHEAKPELINFYRELGFQLVTSDGLMHKKLRNV